MSSSAAPAASAAGSVTPLVDGALMTLTAITAQHGPVAMAPRFSRTANQAAQAPDTQSSAPRATLNSHCASPSSPVTAAAAYWPTM